MGTMLKLQIEDLPDPKDRFILEDCLAIGVSGKVYAARDTDANNRKVAIKMLKVSRENFLFIQEEYRVLQEFATQPNFLDFYGTYRQVQNREDVIWFVMELCEGGTVLDLVNSLLNKNRRMSEEHIAYILKETIKGLTTLHEHRVMHRDIKASNILLTKEGEVKLVDFGLARHLSSTFGKSDTRLGSPCWMAPEVVTSTPQDEDSGYGNRADVWSLGITAIELGDGKAPFADMHPTRAMFQIVRNPPPTLYRPANWSEAYNDFINECLVKNPEHRAFIMELIEHPFMELVPENNYHLSQEIKLLLSEMDKGQKFPRYDTLVLTNLYKKNREDDMQQMYVEDLAALEKISEESVLHELQARMKIGEFHTFIGNILLILNPNCKQDIYGEQYHKKYKCKSKCENSPHIYAIAESAYQDALHQIIPQNIVLGGESGSGKTTNFMHLLDHLLYVGKNDNINSDRLKDAMKLIHAFTHASTPYNDYSTRAVLRTEVTFGSTGKVSGAIFTMNQLEKWRISSVDMSQSNYHMLYYFYDGIEAKGDLDKYNLNPGRRYRYLRIPDENTSRTKPRDNPTVNVKKWETLQNIYKMFEFDDDQVEMINKVLAATILIGDVKFYQNDQGVAEIENEHIAANVAKLLEADEKKMVWSLTNYCLIKKGTAVRRRHSCDEARDARDVFANTMYSHMVDYIINYINHKLSYGRTIFGEKFSVRLLDIYGFECFKENHLTQLFINCLNEQLHYHFVQRVFTWECLEMNEEDVPFTPLNYYDNKATLDEILGKPEGLLMLIDDASKMANSGEYIIDYLKTPQRNHINVVSALEFSVAHYTGKVTYNSKEMPDRNRDFLPPEVIETLRLSKNKHVKALFTGKLTKTGNLMTSFEGSLPKSKSRLKFSSSSDEDNLKENEPQFSQITKMRTTVATFRSLCLNLLKELSVGGSAGGTHFVRCLRSDLDSQPRGFHMEIVKQQLRAMAVVDTVRARQKGFPHRIPFSEFLRRYKFLAFDFDENVEVSKDNCRLLLVRLKMEGWMIGKSKVFLKYYNEEYLARLYENQVKKIIKIQSMMRGFLAKLNLKKKLNKENSASINFPRSVEEIEEDKAARVLQKAYRGVANRKAYGPIITNPAERLDAATCKFIRNFASKWKAKSMFQVLLQYRAARYQDMFNFSQQVHFFNQQIVCCLQKYNNNIGLDVIDRHAKPQGWLGEIKPSVLKLPFRLVDIPYFDTSYMCDPLSNPGVALDKDEDWDAPFQWRDNISSKIANTIQETQIAINKPYSANFKAQPTLHRPSEPLTNLPYSRDPDEPVRRLSTVALEQPEPSSGRNLFRDNNSPQPPPMSNIHFNPKQNNPQQHSYNPTNSYSSNINAINNQNAYNNQRNQLKSPGYNSRQQEDRVNPIAELRTIGAKNNNMADEDDPPFNFQAMLRKTNTNRDSMKRGVETKRMSLKSMRGYSQENLVFDSRQSSFRKANSVDNLEQGQRQKLEIAPGIFMEGLVADL